jgi:hypothetical protein
MKTLTKALSAITELNSLQNQTLNQSGVISAVRAPINQAIARRANWLDRPISIRQYGDMRQRTKPSRLALEWWRWAKKQRLHHG